MIDLQLLGGLDVVGPDLSPGTRSRRRHPMMLLALVAAGAPQAMSRDRIMAFLWPESDSARASNSLRQALHGLRRDLGEDLFLPETPSGIQLDPGKIAVDLWTFRDAIARKDYADAVTAHRGAFLDGLQAPSSPELSRWVESERALVEREYVAALDALARDAEESGRDDDAVTWRRRHAAADPYSSRAALGLLKALTAAGDRPGALAYAAVHENFLRAHLEVEPDPAVTEFVASLRRPTPPDRAAATTRMPPATPVVVEEPPAALAIAPTAFGSAIDIAPAPRRLRQGAGRRWIVALGLASIGVVGIGAGYSMSVREPAAAPAIVLGSAIAAVDGRDPSNQLVACAGPECPRGSLPQPAYVVPAHEAYELPAGGTQYISPAHDGTTREFPGYPCCTVATFENVFTLPRDVESATISISILADNQGIVAINGMEFGRQADSVSQWNFAGRPTTFATTFSPDPSGTNRLRVSLKDLGGVGGLNYRAVVTYGPRKAESDDK